MAVVASGFGTDSWLACIEFEPLKTWGVATTVSMIRGSQATGAPTRRRETGITRPIWRVLRNSEPRSSNEDNT
ncbi:hypothetical protein TNCV_1003701 [Trichonephila clavipes]|nr:hypothetical protein TNCV_1003701 [Trichonephila clavipes]